VALNFFTGWTLDELLARRREIQEALSSTHTQVNSEGTDGTIANMSDLQSKLQMVQEALYFLDPITYPLTDSVRITRTKGRFSGGLCAGQELV
jgi:hypothetical protein